MPSVTVLRLPAPQPACPPVSPPARVLCRFQRRGIVAHSVFLAPSPQSHGGLEPACPGPAAARKRPSRCAGASWSQPPCLSVTPGAGVRSPGRRTLPRQRSPNRPPKELSPRASPSPKPAVPPTCRPWGPEPVLAAAVLWGEDALWPELPGRAVPSRAPFPSAFH